MGGMNIIRIIKRWYSDTCGKGRAAHVASGNQHSVILSNVRVVIVPDGDRWFAQGIDINYATGGATIRETQRNFEMGLSMTIRANLQRLGNIDRIMRTPDADVWMPLILKHGSHFDFSMKETHELNDTDMPYNIRIQYEGMLKAA